MAKQKIHLSKIDLRLIAFFNKAFMPVARFAIFLVYFWFGFIKLLGLSPASPLAKALVANTVGLQYFHSLFYILAVFECIIGILFLFPKATRIVIPLLLIHLVIVCSPLLLIRSYTWQKFGVPTLEGQYIIKNAVVIALAIGVASSTKPLSRKAL